MSNYPNWKFFFLTSCLFKTSHMGDFKLTVTTAREFFTKKQEDYCEPAVYKLCPASQKKCKNGVLSSYNLGRKTSFINFLLPCFLSISLICCVLMSLLLLYCLLCEFYYQEEYWTNTSKCWVFQGFFYNSYISVISTRESVSLVKASRTCFGRELLYSTKTTKISP